MSRVSVFTLLSKSDKNMGAVNSRVRDYALELVKRSYHEGINVLITSGFRSYAEQTKLYNQGRSAKGNVVTNAKAGYSIHNFGYAIDYVVCNDKGVPVWTVTNDWKRVGQIGKSMGFQWGGDWTSFKDYPHLDFQKNISLAQFRAGVRPNVPSLPSRGYLGAGDSGEDVKALQRLANGLKAGLEVDGVYGDDCTEWVKAFQKKYGLLIDGLYGNQVKSKINDLLKQKPVSEKPKVEVKPVKNETPEWKKEFDKTYDKAVKLKITDGSERKAAATKEEVAVMIVRALDLK